ncbi:hypothetical protein KIPB_012562, partial [Kipferlia bialata]
ETVLRTLLLRSPESKRDMVAQMCERFIKDVSEKHSSLATGYRTVVTETLALKSLVLAPHSDRFFRPSDKAVELVVDTVGIKKIQTSVYELDTHGILMRGNAIDVSIDLTGIHPLRTFSTDVSQDTRAASTVVTIDRERERGCYVVEVAAEG